jgi:hypothetical protein
VGSDRAAGARAHAVRDGHDARYFRPWRNDTKETAALERCIRAGEPERLEAGTKRFEIDFKLPAGISAGTKKLECRLGHRYFGATEIVVTADPF